MGRKGPSGFGSATTAEQVAETVGWQGEGKVSTTGGVARNKCPARAALHRASMLYLLVAAAAPAAIASYCLPCASSHQPQNQETPHSQTDALS